MASVFINPLTDFGFKRLFGTEHNKNLLISFLNTLLPEHHQIEELEYADSTQHNHSEFEREAIFDLHCKGRNGEVFIIEMQRAPQSHFMSRLLYYATFPIRDMAEKGEWDYRLRPIYSIAILNFDLAHKRTSSKIVNHHQITDDEGVVSEQNLRFITVQLRKFNKEDPDALENDFERWLYVLRYLDGLNDRPRALQERIWMQIFEEAKIAKLPSKELKHYEESLKRHRDYKSTVDHAVHEGLKKGLAQASEKVKKAEAERQKAEAEKQKAEAEKQKAEAEKQKAEAEKQKAELMNIVFRLFLTKNLSAKQIAEQLGQTEEWVKQVLKGQ